MPVSEALISGEFHQACRPLLNSAPVSPELIDDVLLVHCGRQHVRLELFVCSVERLTAVRERALGMP
jgi:hypothetical protein